MIRGAGARVIRLAAIVGKELVESIRRPGAIVSLVLGPFLILALFSVGYDGIRRPLDTIVVVPPTSGLPTDPAKYQEVAGGGLRIVAVTPDARSADVALADGQADLVVVAPADPQADLRAGRQATMEVRVDTVDPLRLDQARVLTSAMAAAVNQRIVEAAVGGATDGADGAASSLSGTVRPEVIAAPTRANVVDTAPTDPGLIDFYGPAVLALVLQHLAITLIALSLIRERSTGAMEIYRVAPVSAGELIAGKMIAFAVLAAVVAATTLGVLVIGFGVPVLAPWSWVVATFVLLVFASLGVGLLIAMLSDSERQGIQLSLLLLLASVFFSGFVLQVDEFTAPVRALTFLLPVTHGIRLLQDLMLRGTTNQGWELVALWLIGGITLVVSLGLLRRGFRPARPSALPDRPPAVAPLPLGGATGERERGTA